MLRSLLLLCLACGTIFHQGFAQTWTALGAGTDGFSVYVIEHDSVNDRLIVGGKFNNAGGIPSRNLAAWNITSQTWSNIGLGTDNAVRSILIDSSGIYYGGDFTTIDGVSTSVSACYFNGTTYEKMGSGFMMTGLHAPMSSIYCFAKYNGQLYAGGVFNMADSAACLYISRWDGSSWLPVGPGVTLGAFGVYDMEVFDGYLYVAGDFNGTTGVTTSKYIMRWDGSNWSAVGSGMNKAVYALEVHEGELYAGGMFTVAGGSTAQHIAKWNGSSWSSVGSIDGDVNSLKSMGGKLYVSGIFNNVNGSPSQRFAAYSTSTGWTVYPIALSSYAFTLESDGSFLYAGGPFSTAGGNPASRIAMFNPTVGINDPGNSSNQIKVWPVPARDHLMVDWEGQPSFGVRIIDSQGRICIQTQVQYGEPVDVSGLPAGIYHLQLQGKDGAASRAILLN